jgi:dienelactone hydrolase
MKKLLTMTGLALTTVFAACNSSSTTESTTISDTAAAAKITTADATYKVDSVTSISYVAYDASKQGPRPVVLVIPEWWGLNDYAKMRARELAKLGYLAMAVDMYGNGKQGETPEAAGNLAGAFYSNDEMVRSRIKAAMDKAKSYPQADTTKVAIIGYCFGGAMGLKAAKLGFPLRGVVSFHGNLEGTANKNAPILICHGEADKFVTAEEVGAWRKSMDSLGAQYTFKSYPGATHAFTNPEATAKGRKFNMPIEYNAAADTASWNDMKQFFSKIF